MTRKARRILHQRRWLGSVMGVLVSTGVLTGVGFGVTRGLGIVVPPLWIAGAAASLFTILEVGVRRARAVRLRQVRGPFEALITAIGPTVEAGWLHGLPYLRGGKGAERFAVHLEAAGEQMRIGLVVEVEPAVRFWLARPGQGFPARRFKRLVEKKSYQKLSHYSDGLRALSPQCDRAETFLGTEEMLSTLCAVLDRVPEASVLDFDWGSVRWDSALTQNFDATGFLAQSAVIRTVAQSMEIEAEIENDTSAADASPV